MNPALLVGTLTIYSVAVTIWLAMEIYQDRKRRMRIPGYPDYVAKAKEYEASTRVLRDIHAAVLMGDVIWRDKAGKVHLDKRPRQVIGAEWVEEGAWTFEP